ncbi:MAG: ATP-binding protein [Gemmatimonadota bacterium]
MTSYPRRIVALAALATLPAVAMALVLLWSGDFSGRLQWTATLVMSLAAGIGLALLHERVVRPLQTVSNLLSAMREGDFSHRARQSNPEDDLGLLYLEANALAEMLRGQRLGAMEATALLRTVMTEIDAAVFTFDDQGTLVLVNRGGERLLDESAERLVGRHAAALGLEDCLGGDTPRVLDQRGSYANRWELRRSSFRRDGRAHTLVLLTDVSRALQAEEREAWQRLIRVLSHEINNSLTPIRSFAGSLQHAVDRGPRTPQGDADLREGLAVIAQRADALGRFIAAYARLARLPRPVLRPVRVEEWVGRVVALESGARLVVGAGPDVTVVADADQLDQLLINLVRNAADASAETGGAVRVDWVLRSNELELTVEDDGKGIADAANLFVPFFTTKPGGSGIGLALSRRIAEAHAGTLTLANRRDGPGCRAVLSLPIALTARDAEATMRSGAHRAVRALSFLLLTGSLS